MNRRVRSFAAVILGLLLMLGACSETHDGDGGAKDIIPDLPVTIPDTPISGDASDITVPEDVTEDMTEEVYVDTAPVVVTSLETLPSSSMFVETEPGKSVLLAINVYLAYSDGSQLDVTDSVLWTTSNAQVVNIDDQGKCFATGQAEGQATLIALYEGLHSDLTVAVKFKDDSPFIIKEGMDSDEVIAFETIANTSGEGHPQWLYPEEGTVFPNGMYPPLLQWVAVDSNYFRLRLTNEDGLSVAIYTTESQYQPPHDLWLAMGAVSKGTVTMEISGAKSLAPDGVVHDAPPRGVVSAHATLAGSVYYWEVKTGSIMRLDSTEQVPEATAVFSDNAVTGQCRGCHALSGDGSKLAYSFNAKGGGELGMAWATAPEPEILEPGSGVIAETMTFGPSGNLMVISDLQRMWLADVTPGINGGAFNLGDIHSVAASGGTERAQTPAWSPDGSALAYSKNYAGNGLVGGGDGSEIMLRFWDAENWKFIDPAVLLPTPTYVERPFHDYPTWTPDSKWIVARSTEKWATSSKNSGIVGLTMVDVKEGGFVELLVAAPVGTEHYGRPAFSPFMEGGYYWLVFYSDRVYGGVKTGNGKQLWVTAIDLDATTDADPSHPAFWLPGQDPTTVNLSGYWAQPFCKIAGDMCEEDQDCCIGHNCTLAPGENVGSCTDSGCDLPGEYCDWKSSNCCPGYVCKQSLTGTFSCQPDWSE